MHTNRVVATPEQAEAVLEYFNGLLQAALHRMHRKYSGA
jgi:hypothetical protein